MKMCKCKNSPSVQCYETQQEESEERIENPQLTTVERTAEKEKKLEQELKDIEAEKTKLMESSYQSILKLRTIALKFDTDSTRQNILSLIEILKNNNEREKVKKLQEMLEESKEGEKVETLQEMLEESKEGEKVETLQEMLEESKRRRESWKQFRRC